MDLDLMITQTEIDLGEDFSTGELIKRISMRGKRYLFLIVTAFKGQ
jgi:hypothetical protein